MAIFNISGDEEQRILDEMQLSTTRTYTFSQRTCIQTKIFEANSQADRKPMETKHLTFTQRARNSQKKKSVSQLPGVSYIINCHFKEMNKHCQQQCPNKIPTRVLSFTHQARRLAEMSNSMDTAVHTAAPVDASPTPQRSDQQSSSK